MTKEFYIVLGIAIVIVLAFCWAMSADEADLEDMKHEEDEWEMLKRKIKEKVDLTIPDMPAGEKEVMISMIAHVSLVHGMEKYKEGFEMGQQVQLQKTVDDLPEEVAEEIMKNQTKSVL